MKDTEREKKKKLLAPLYVIKEEKLYLIWIVFVVFFGLINIWAGIFLWQIDSIAAALQEGIVYTYSISICAPFLAEVFLKQIVKKRTGEKPDFVFYQIISSAVNIIWILILTLLWLGSLKSKVWLQIICGLLSSFFAFYMYCVGQMEQHKAAMRDFNDEEYGYLNEERERMEKTGQDAQNVKTIEDSEGGIEL